MSQANALRAADVRAVFRLVGECRELGDDPVLWRRHLLVGLTRLTGGGFGVAAEIGDGTQPLEGDTDKQAAARLGLTRHTVNQYAKLLFRHFGVRSRAELLARWVRRGWGGRFAWADSPDFS